MTNALVQELCKHITRLESENEQLEATIARNNTLFEELCNASGCLCW
jgi:hypothetical protein